MLSNELRALRIALVGVLCGLLLSTAHFAHYSAPHTVSATNAIRVALDCDVTAPGIQASCTVSSGTSSLDVAIVALNQDPSAAVLAAFNIDVLADQLTLSPPAAVNLDLDSNPDFALSPIGTWQCTPPDPGNDVDPNLSVADSFLSCFDAGGGTILAAFGQLVLATVHYDVVGQVPSTSLLQIANLSLTDFDTIEFASCNPAGNPYFEADCTPTTIDFTCNGDGDCDGVSDAVDNCPTTYNIDQANTDRNFIDLPSSWAFDDTTRARSDALGDACDADEDNDGISNTDEANIGPGGSSHASCPTASANTDPLREDTDGDLTLDGAECGLGTDPTNASSKPPASPPGDTDHDGLTDAYEAVIGTNPTLPDTDGDKLNDGVEVKGYNSGPLSLNTDGDACSDGKEAASVNGDNTVNSTDQLIVSQSFGLQGSPNYFYDFDVNRDGNINSTDQLIQSKVFGNCP
jgi:hypothetical protein